MIPFETGPLVLHSAAGANANGVVVDCDGFATVCVQLSGTLTSAIISWEGSVDKSTWVGVLGWNRTTGVKALTANATGLFVISTAGLSQFRARLAWTSGAVTATAKCTELPTTTLVTAA